MGPTRDTDETDDVGGATVRTLTFAAALLGTLWLPVAGHAQAETTAWIEARGGLTSRPSSEVPLGWGAVVFEARAGAPWAGVGFGARLLDRWGARVVVDHSPEAPLDGQWTCTAADCPLWLVDVAGRAQHWSVGWDLEYTPTVWLGHVRPTLFAGLGARQSRIRWGGDAARADAPGSAYEELSLTGRFGTRLATRLGPAELFGEVDGSLGRMGARRQERAVLGAASPSGSEYRAALGLGVGLSAGLRWHLR